MTSVGVAGVLLIAGAGLSGGALGATADSTPAESDPVTEVTEVTDVAEVVDTSEADDSSLEWTQIVPGGESECADASEFSFWVREADPTKVVFFLQGGACFDEAT